MKKIAITIILIMVLLVPTLAISTVKIKENDKWKYKDKDGRDFDEEAVDLLLYGSMAVAKINTTRSYPLVINNIISDDLELNLNYNQSALYITQLGAIPIFFDGLVSGIVSYGNYTILINDSKIEFDEYLETNDPSNSISSNNPTSYQIMFFIPFSNTSYIQFTIDLIISSIVNDTTFTIQYERYKIKINDVDNQFLKNYYIDDVNLKLSSLDAYKFIIDEFSSLPRYIIQSEPVKTTSDLGLSQSTELIEYFLVEVSESNTEGSPFYLSLFAFIPVIIYKKFKINIII
jgi:hypothetical protein